MNPIAARMIDVQLLFEDGTAPEISEVCRIGAEEIQRLQGIRDRAIEALWRNRRFYFKTLGSPANTPLAVIFNNLLDVLGQTPEEDKANWAKHYPDSIAGSTADTGEKHE